MPHLFAQVVFPGESGLPEDVFINTFHFSSVSDDAAAHNVVADHLVELYNTPVTGGSPIHQSIGSFMGFAVKHGPGLCKVKVYDWADPKPRPVKLERSFTLAGVGSGYVNDLPAEVALCATFWGEANRPRTRGRVYLGPFGNHAAGIQVLGRAVPSINLRQSVAASFGRLINKAANTQNLAIWSRGKYQVDGVAQPEVPGTLTVATDGWCDDAWDTQRRRGQDATTRTTFT